MPPRLKLAYGHYMAALYGQIATNRLRGEVIRYFPPNANGFCLVTQLDDGVTGSSGDADMIARRYTARAKLPAVDSAQASAKRGEEAGSAVNWPVASCSYCSASEITLSDDARRRK